MLDQVDQSISDTRNLVTLMNHQEYDGAVKGHEDALEP